MVCPCCQNISIAIFIKSEYKYYQCSDCKTIFTPNGINQEGLVGGKFEEERNEKENEDRIGRGALLVGCAGRYLDFGCGHGLLVRDLLVKGLRSDGYDMYNPDFNVIPPGKKYNLIYLIETIEHFSQPYSELDMILYLLAENGVVYIETSFIDTLEEPFDNNFYIAPEVGHSTVFSHKGLDALMTRKGFQTVTPINGNVRLYQKP